MHGEVCLIHYKYTKWSFINMAENNLGTEFIKTISVSFKTIVRPGDGVYVD